MMKKILFGLIAFAFVACSSGENKTKEVSAKNTEIVEVILNIGGLHCESCVASVEKGINGLNGINNLVVSLDDSTAIMKYDASQLDIDEIKKAVEKRGYTVKSTE